MKKIYRSILKWFVYFPTYINAAKYYLAEWFAIFRKSSLYKDIKWTKEQQKEFDDFWKKNYGKKISNRWHRLYEACNGVHRIDYFPEILYSTKLEKKRNDYLYCKVFSNKSFNDVLFDDKILGVKTPKCFVFNDNGTLYNGKREIINFDTAINLLQNIGEAVIKPTIDTSSGRGVVILNIKNGINIRDGRNIKDIILDYKQNFIIQEKVIPCKELELLYPNSINTIRVITYIIGNDIGFAPISLRIGGGGGEVDNIHAGGMVVFVDNNGNLGNFAYRLGWGDNFEKFDKHPDTKITFNNYNLKFIPRVVEIAKSLHTKTSNVGIISWDFTIDSNEEIIVIEANYLGQSIWFPQMISGKSFFGDDTIKILNYLKNN